MPDRWGDDKLSQFLQVSHENAFFVFAHHRPVFDLLTLVHDVFDAVVGISSQTSPQWAAMFVVRAHAAWLAATRLALSGEVAESFAPLRTSIEIAWYGLHAISDPEETKRMETWLKRDDGEAARWDVVKAFRSGALKETHQARDAETAKVLESLYERAIAHGAHPNPAGFLTSIIREEDEKSITHKVLVLNAQPLPVMFALKSAVEVAVGLLRVFRLMYAEPFAQHGIVDGIDAIIARLNVVFQPYVPKPD